MGSRFSGLPRVILLASLTGMGLLSAVRVGGYDPIPWGWLAGFAVGTAVLAGPVAWYLRDRLSKERRKTLGYVAAGAAILLVPVVLWLGLLSGALLLVLDTAVLGGLVGLAVVALAERTVVPPRLRGAAR